jgi:uncharacterized protein (TIGR02118 family)
MIKVVSWFRRKPGMSVEDFARYWRYEHPKVVLRLPGLRKYVQNHPLASQYARGEPFADGIAETWWDDRASLHALRDTGLLEELLIDEAAFQAEGSLDQLVTKEVVVVNGPIPEHAVKVITWLRRRPDLSLEQAQTYWRTNHAAVASRIPDTARYVQCHHVPGGTEHRHMGLPMVWYPNIDVMRANAKGAELAATSADEANFLVADDLPFVVVEEHHII